MEGSLHFFISSLFIHLSRYSRRYCYRRHPESLRDDLREYTTVVAVKKKKKNDQGLILLV
jgi:hypothetical protein